MEDKRAKAASLLSVGKEWFGVGKAYIGTLSKEGKKQLDEFQQRDDVKSLVLEARRLQEDASKEGMKKLEAFHQREDVQGALSEAARLSEAYGVTDFAEKVFGTTGQAIDSLSGKKLLIEVQQMMALQQQYNDVLATKLAEALARIDALEAAMSESNRP